MGHGDQDKLAKEAVGCMPAAQCICCMPPHSTGMGAATSGDMCLLQSITNCFQPADHEGADRPSQARGKLILHMHHRKDAVGTVKHHCIPTMKQRACERQQTHNTRLFSYMQYACVSNSWVQHCMVPLRYMPACNCTCNPLAQACHEIKAHPFCSEGPALVV